MSRLLLHPVATALGTDLIRQRSTKPHELARTESLPVPSVDRFHAKPVPQVQETNALAGRLKAQLRVQAFSLRRHEQPEG